VIKRFLMVYSKLPFLLIYKKGDVRSVGLGSFIIKGSSRSVSRGRKSEKGGELPQLSWKRRVK